MTNENQQEATAPDGRAEFEAWYRRAYDAEYLHIEDGDYLSTHTSGAWASWQASRAAMPQMRDDTELLQNGLKQSVLNVVHKWADTCPEVDDDESWEEWFSAAFDLMANDIGNVFEELAAARLGKKP